MTSRHTSNDLPPVTVIGLGPMGRALAGVLLSNGHATTVWTRTTAKADQLVAQGARLAESVQKSRLARESVEWAHARGVTHLDGAIIEWIRLSTC